MSEEQKARKREYYQKNKVEIERRKKERRLKNIEESRARDRASYDRRRDKILAQKQEQYDKNVKPSRTTRDWRPIIQKVKEELDYYTSLRIRPTLRTIFYRLYSKGIINNTRSDYAKLSRTTTAARERRKTNVSRKKRKLEKNIFQDFQ